jgi:transposase
LSIVVTAANRNDCIVLDDLLAKRFSPAKAHPGKPLPVENLCLDAGYVGKSQTAVSNGFVPHIRPRGEERKLIEKGFKAKRWIVELGHSWYNRFRKIHVRYEKEEVSFLGLVHLASAMIVFNRICSIYPA